MTIESIPTSTNEDMTLAEAMVDQASELLATAIEGSPDPGDALERALENLENRGLDIPKPISEETEVSKDWHEREHSWAIVTDRLLDANIFRSIIPQDAKVRIIGRMLLHDQKWSQLNNDFREPEDKDNVYYRDRLKAMQRTRR